MVISWYMQQWQVKTYLSLLLPLRRTCFYCRYIFYFFTIEMLFKSKEVLKYFREWGPMVQNSIGNKVFCRSDSLFFYTKFKYTLQKSVFQCRNNNDTMGDVRWMLVCVCVVGKGRFGHLKLKLISQDHRSRQWPLPGRGKPLQPKLCLAEIFLCLLLQVFLFFFVLVPLHNFLPSVTSPKINRQKLWVFQKINFSLLINHFLCYGSKQKLTN